MIMKTEVIDACKDEKAREIVIGIEMNITTIPGMIIKTIVKMIKGMTRGTLVGRTAAVSIETCEESVNMSGKVLLPRRMSR